jgi:hypothetical protein
LGIEQIISNHNRTYFFIGTKSLYIGVATLIFMSKKKVREYKEKMIYQAFFLSKVDVKRIERLTDLPCFPLETKSDVIRHCIKLGLEGLEAKYFRTRSGSS